MERFNSFRYFVLEVFCGLLVLSSCENKHLYQGPDEKSKGDYFDFATTKTVAVDVDYGFQGLENYRILFEIYGEDPFVTDENGAVSKKSVEPLFRAATDAEGKFSDPVSLPVWADEVYVCSDYLGAMSVAKVAVSNGRMQLRKPGAVVKSVFSRAVTAQTKATYPSDLTALGSWDIWGMPDYLLPERATPPANLLYGIKEVLGGWLDIRNKYPELVKQGVRVETNIRKKTEIKLVFLSSTATKRNVVGYYTYPTGNPPARVEDIQHKIIAFPEAVSYYGRDGVSRFGAMNFGDQIQLKYWNGTELVNEFPEGVSIGWFLMESAYDPNTGNIKSNSPVRYSDPELNSDKYQRTIALYDGTQANDMIALGFEDAWSVSGGGNFGDALFYLDMDKDAVDSGELPSLPETDGPKDDNNYTTYRGTLAFEDMWPREGDYDMNDVVIIYESKVYKRIVGNQVYKIVDRYTPYNDGAYFRNAFGYQMDKITPDMIGKVTIEGPTTSSFMKGQSMEPGQAHPTFILFDDARIAYQKGESYIVTVEFKKDVNSSLCIPPYNPFIIIEANQGRGKEVHLVNYTPTSLADMSLFGQQHDKSRPDDGLYYVSDNAFPFALNLSGILNYNCPTEGVRIDKEYPDFSGWVTSGGTTNTKWYLNKK